MEEFERIAILNDEVEARLVDAILSERGIPHLLDSYYDSAYDGVFQVAKGWGHVEAPAAYKEEILAILEDVRSRGGQPE